MQVLIVDDASTMRKIVARSLRQAGLRIEVLEAADGLAALRAFDPATCDLVLADQNMPEMNGLELVRNLRRLERENPGGRHVPVIMVTTEGGSERAREALDVGVDAFMTKPFTPQQLGATVREVMRLLGRDVDEATEGGSS